jgi:phosphatidate cytidylyltransferase
MALTVVPQTQQRAQSWSFLRGQTWHERVVPGIWVGLIVLAIVMTTRQPVVIEVVAVLAATAMYLEAVNLLRKMGSSPAMRWEKPSWPIPVVAQIVAIAALPFTLIPLVSKGGPKAVVLLIGCTFIADITAYYVGRSLKHQWFGERHFFHDVSPNKCLEGWVAGLIVALIVGVTLKLSVGLPISLWVVLPLTLVATILGFTGDLMESWFKRSTKAKDTSRLLRGHGGILDRCDDLLYVSPLLYLVWVALLPHHWV